MAVILIVEDDIFTRDMAEMMIQEWGHETLSATDVDEALLLVKSPQHIDALFTDIYLKKAVLGGCDLARDAVKLRPELRVLYTTGNSPTDEMKSLFVDGRHARPAAKLGSRLARGLTSKAGVQGGIADDRYRVRETG
jgi:CheY-like chemotaxis protein